MKHLHPLTSVATVLLEELALETAALQAGGQPPLAQAEACLLLVLQKMEVLKTAFFAHKDLPKEAEMAFFKHTKPLLASQLIYYYECYGLELKKPLGSPKAQRKYFLAAYEKLTDFMAAHQAFYLYYRSGATSHDERYFLRQSHTGMQEQEVGLFHNDCGYSTSHDHKVAQLLAQESLKAYIEKQLFPVPATVAEPVPPKQKISTLQWTASKVALVELVYALHASGVFNNGQCKLKTTMETMEQVFQTDLRNYHRVFLEIRARKIERTKFIQNMQTKLVGKMEVGEGVVFV